MTERAWATPALDILVALIAIAPLARAGGLPVTERVRLCAVIPLPVPGL